MFPASSSLRADPCDFSEVQAQGLKHEFQESRGNKMHFDQHTWVLNKYWLNE